MRKLNVKSVRAGTTSSIIVGNETRGNAARYPMDFHGDENVCDCECCWNSRFGRSGREFRSARNGMRLQQELRNTTE